VSGLTSGVSAIASGYNHTCALTAGGGVKCWGFNSYGQLGDGTTANSAVPVDVNGLTGGVVAIAAGRDFSCAVTSEGAVKCWGLNNYGQLGDGTTTNSFTPVDVSGLTNSTEIISIGTGYHVCALTTSGGVKCWGYNAAGQLGNGTTENSSVPVDVNGLTSGVVDVSSGTSHSCAVTSGGGAVCWGDNSFGQLGDGTTTGSITPVNVSGLSSGASRIAAGFADTCALTAGGGVKCWGSGAFGALGNGTNVDSNIPVDVSGMSGGISAIYLGDYFGCAVTAGGGVKCWGKNSNGQLGDGTQNNSNVPVDVLERA
jgi:alpha-tubulin suppressor-like RCC1 family protein